VPALSERRDDIEALVEALGEDIARRSGMPQKLLSTGALDWLQQQRWPGNIRELRNVLEQASLMSDELQLSEHSFAAAMPTSVNASEASALPKLLPNSLSAIQPRQSAPSPTSPASGPDTAVSLDTLRPLPERIEAVERDAIAEALRLTGGNRMATARLLQISRASLYERLARWPDLMATHVEGSPN